MTNILIFNGGRGAKNLILELQKFNNLRMTSIVNAYDDGKSTGKIREFFDMLGPSDIRKTMELMLPKTDKHYKLKNNTFKFRFNKNIKYQEAIIIIKKIISGKDYANELFIDSTIKKFLNYFLEFCEYKKKTMNKKLNFSDSSLVNCIFAGAFLYTKRDFDLTIETLCKTFNLQHQILVNSPQNKFLTALRLNGKILYTEAEIVELRSSVKIKNIYLLDQSIKSLKEKQLSPKSELKLLNFFQSNINLSVKVKEEILKANIIIFSAGTQHSSLYPTYLTSGLADTIKKNQKAYKFYITNIGADYETPRYKTSDYIKGAFKYLTKTSNKKFNYKDFFDYNLINKTYSNKKVNYVKHDPENFDKIQSKIILDNYESLEYPGQHDGEKLVKTILQISNLLYEK